MKQVSILLVAALFITLGIDACQSKEPVPEPIAFEPGYLNTQIRLAALSTMNSFKVGEPIALFLTYDAGTSGGDIVFKDDFGQKIFVKDNNKWVEVVARQITGLPDEIILSSLNSEFVVFVYPELFPKSKVYDVRVYVFGNMITDNGVREVGAFVEFQLFPISASK